MSVKNCQDLWRGAIDLLTPDELGCFEPARTRKRDVLAALSKTVLQKRQLLLKKQWQADDATPEQGVIPRDIVEKILYWVQQFSAIAGQPDLQSAGLFWATLRYFLQKAVAEHETNLQLVIEIEMAARLAVKFAHVEEIIPEMPAADAAMLKLALTEAYSTLLRPLAKALGSIGNPAIPIRIFDEQDMKVILDRESSINNIVQSTDRILITVDDASPPRLSIFPIDTHRSINEQAMRDISSWLCPDPTSSAHEYLKSQILPGTGQWFNDHPDFGSWMSKSSCSMLLLTGAAGCGKSIICSSFIDKYTSAQAPASLAPLAFMFCNHREAGRTQNTAQDVIRSLIRQLAIRQTPSSTAHSALLAAYDRYSNTALQNGTEVKRLTIPDSVDLMLQFLDDNPAVLVIDALDKVEDYEQLLYALDAVANRSRNVLKILMTSQKIPDIVEKLSTVETLYITPKDIEADLCIFAAHLVDKAIQDRDLHIRRNNSSLRNDVVQGLINGSRDSFLHLQLRLLRLRSLHSESRIRHGVEANSAKTVHESYLEINEQVSGKSSSTPLLGMLSLPWVLNAKKNISAAASLYPIAIATRAWQRSVDEVLHACHGLVCIDERSNGFRLVHDSVVNELFASGNPLDAFAHGMFAQACLGVLHNAPSSRTIDDHAAKELSQYAIAHWLDHAFEAEGCDHSFTLTPGLRMFLTSRGSDKASVFSAWMNDFRAYVESLPRHDRQGELTQFLDNDLNFPLTLTCALGLATVLEYDRWPADFDWNAIDSHGHTALYAAARYGHTGVILFLLDQGADIDQKGGKLGSALHVAAAYGHADVVKTLLDRGANRRIGTRYDSVVHAACAGGHEALTLSILDTQSMQDQAEYVSVLLAVSAAGFVDSLSLLLDLEFRDALEASERHHVVVSIVSSGCVDAFTLLKEKLTIDETLPANAFALAAVHGSQTMILHLIDCGYLIDQADLDEALHHAAASGHTQLSRMLLNHGADVNSSGIHGNALQAAAAKGHLHIMKLLLQAGADVNDQSATYGTCLQAAAYNGHSEAVSLLLQSGAKPQASGLCRDSFHAAIEGGHKHILELLLDSGSSVTPASRAFGAAQRRMASPARNILRESSPGFQEQRKRKYAALRSKNTWNSRRSWREPSVGGFIGMSGSSTMLKTYQPRQNRAGRLGFGRGEDEVYLLEAAAASGDFEMAMYVLSQRDYLDIHDTSMNEALIVACECGHEKIAREIETRMTEGTVPLQEALQSAASHGRIDVVRWLLSRSGASEHSEHLQTALAASMDSGEKMFLEVLDIMDGSLTGHEVQQILTGSLRTSVYSGHAGIIQKILSRTSFTDEVELVRLLLEACERSHVASVKTLHESVQPGHLSRAVHSKCVLKAVTHGNSDVLRHLITIPNREISHTYHKCAIICAAGCGDLEMLEMLLDTYELRGKGTLHQALAIAAQNGHVQTCECLLSVGADPCMAMPPLGWHDMTPSGCNDNLSPVGDTEPVDGREREMLVPRYWNGATRFNAVTSCIYGFQRFQDKLSNILHHRGLQWQHRPDMVSQTSTLLLLLEHIANLGGPEWNEAFCAAVSHCSPEIIELMLGKGANATAHVRNKSVLHFAVARECLCHPAMQLLVSKGAAVSLDESDWRDLLVKAVSHFQFGEDSPDVQGALLKDTKSISEVFTTGPGAVVFSILERYPNLSLVDEQCAAMMQCASVDGRLEVMKLLLEHHASVDALGSYYGTALQAASRFGHASIVQLLLEHRARVDILQGRHHTALRAAVLGKSLEVTQMLLKAGADTELSAPRYRSDRDIEDDATALHLALHLELVDIAMELIAAGANIFVQRRDHYSALMYACKIGDLLLVKTLLQAGADINERNKAGHFIIGDPVYSKGYMKSLQEDVQTKKGIPIAQALVKLVYRSVMHVAVYAAHVDVIKLLLTEGFDLCSDFRQDEVPLVFAVQTGNEITIDVLLQAEKDVPDVVLYEALNAAALWGHHSIFEKLLFLRPSVLDRNNAVELLVTASRAARVDVVETLLEELAYRGLLESACTSMLSAQPRGRPDVFEMILEYVPCTEDLFVEACVCDNEGIIRTGLGQGISPNAVDSKGRPALQVATMHGSRSAVQILLEAGASPNAEDSAYGTPLRAALERFAIKNMDANNLPIEHLEYINLMSGEPESHEKVYGQRQSAAPRAWNYLQARALESIARMLISHGASLEGPSGPLGGLLTLAAFTGSRSNFNMLLQAGASPSLGGYLQSPLVAATEGGHLTLAAEILELNSNIGNDDRLRIQALCTACKRDNLPVVKMLLRHGIDCHAKTDSGSTPFRIALAKLSDNDLARTRRHVRAGWQSAESIVLELLETQSPVQYIDEDVIMASGGWNHRVRAEIVLKMIPRMESKFLPEAAYVAVMAGHDRWTAKDFVDKLLDEDRLPPLSTQMLTATPFIIIYAKLLDHNPSYVITAETMDSVPRADSSAETRAIAKLLMLRNEALSPSACNITTLLDRPFIKPQREKHVPSFALPLNFPGSAPAKPTTNSGDQSAEQMVEKSFPEDDTDDVLEMMFLRNPEVKVTERMLIAVKYAADLKVLLARTTPAEGLVTARVMSALAGKIENFSMLLEMLLEFDPSVQIPTETADKAISLSGLTGLRMLWSHRPTLHLSNDSVVQLIKPHHAHIIRTGTGKDWNESRDVRRYHEGVIEQLKTHRECWKFTAQACESIERQFREENERGVKELYYTLCPDEVE